MSRPLPLLVRPVELVTTPTCTVPTSLVMNSPELIVRLELLLSASVPKVAVHAPPMLFDRRSMVRVVSALTVSGLL
jgi:hypothetical protein